MRSISRALSIISLILVLSLVTVGIASAHAPLASSTPAASATVAAPPASVTLVFKSGIKAGSNGSVTDASGATVSTGSQILTSDPDRKTLVVALKPALPNGVYKVSYLSVAEDGAQLQGSFGFGVNAPVPASLAKTEVEIGGDDDADSAPKAPAPAAAAGPARTPTQLPRTGGLPVELLAGLGAGLVALGAVARRRG